MCKLQCVSDESIKPIYKDNFIGFIWNNFVINFVGFATVNCSKTIPKMQNIVTKGNNF